ncbi:MAG TPA: hypothetical protein VMQ76_01600 [Terracidiphilus sp.]|jgi:hypothetical protein|nr:hypothetical protein [Terracidiphilus sp.]
MKRERFEIDPRPAEVGGGWQLRLIGRDEETGEEIDMGGGSVPAVEGEEDKDAYADLLEVGEDWLAVDSEA